MVVDNPHTFKQEPWIPHNLAWHFVGVILTGYFGITESLFGNRGHVFSHSLFAAQIYQTLELI